MEPQAGEASGGAPPWGPYNTVRVVDPSPVNWLSITWNTTEEANRVDHEGMGQPSLAAGWRWVDDETLELDVRRGAVFQDGEKYDAQIFKLAFDKVQVWTSGTPPRRCARCWRRHAKDAGAVEMQQRFQPIAQQLGFPGGTLAGGLADTILHLGHRHHRYIEAFAVALHPGSPVQVRRSRPWGAGGKDVGVDKVQRSRAH